MDIPICDLSGAKVLLVDDTPENLRVLRQALEPEGYSILISTSGEIALRIAKSAQPDLILLDVRMPGIDGFETCRQLKQNEDTRDIPVIFVTAQSETQSLVEGFQVGGIDYIQKPFQNEEVLARVQTHLRVRRLSLEVESAHQRIIDEMEHELQSAHDMQMSLMPKEQPRIEGLDIAGICRPARHVGGDFYQYFQRDGKLMICLADVTGKGMEAAIPVVLFDGILESEMDHGGEITQIFERLNNMLYRKLPGLTAVCLAAGELDLSTCTLTLANGGCPYPYHFHGATKQLVELQTSAYPLSVRPDIAYPSIHAQLETGDYLIFCSDGIVEAENPNRDQFGFDRTFDAFKAACIERDSAEEVLHCVLNEVGDFQQDADQSDDITCVVLRVTSGS